MVWGGHVRAAAETICGGRATLAGLSSIASGFCIQIESPTMSQTSKSRTGEAEDVTGRTAIVEDADVVFEEEDLNDPSSQSIKLTGEIWDVWINCKGSKERWVKANVDKVAYKAYITNNKNTSDGVESNGSSDMPETEWPSHARKITKHTQDGKQVGCGTLKGLSASAKRLKSSSRKLKVEFSAKLGGPCGDNRRTFVDEVVMYTRIRTPLIGVRKWKDVKQDVKNSIVDCVMKVSTQNSTNRHQMKTMHLMGSKPFSQCSWEQNNTARKLAMTDSHEAGDEGSRSVTFGGQVRRCFPEHIQGNNRNKINTETWTRILWETNKTPTS
uniref:Uncharacterized protein n=1 Tax=Oryza rufipogon TaxID=4529 RepID=A0A0E0QPF1_ORYRU